MSEFQLIDSGAEFSPCRTWRYRLWRRWDTRPLLMVVGLNPSTADETQDDPTIRRCLDFARRWGFGGLRMLNAFAFRATDPVVMKAAPDPLGPENLRTLKDWARITVLEGGAVLAAWGNDGNHRNLGSDIRWFLAKGAGGRNTSTGGVACLGLTKSEQPKHPLYIAANTRPIPFIGDGGRLVTDFRPVDTAPWGVSDDKAG